MSLFGELGFFVRSVRRVSSASLPSRCSTAVALGVAAQAVSACPCGVRIRALELRSLVPSVTMHLTHRSSGLATGRRCGPSFHSGPYTPARGEPLSSNVRCRLFMERVFSLCAAPARSRALVRWRGAAGRGCAPPAGRATGFRGPRSECRSTLGVCLAGLSSASSASLSAQCVAFRRPLSRVVALPPGLLGVQLKPSRPVPVGSAFGLSSCALSCLRSPCT